MPQVEIKTTVAALGLISLYDAGEAPGGRSKNECSKGFVIRSDHSINTPAALIGAAHFSISPATNFCKYAGDRRSGATMVAAKAPSRCCTDGVSNVAMVA